MAFDGRVNVDILHTIFSHLQEDAPTLISSATVCKLWRDVALPHVFARLVVRRRMSFSDLVVFLDANPRIASYVRHLTLAERRHSGRGNILWLSPKTLIPIISRLPGLRRLSTGQLLQISGDPARDAERERVSLPIPLLRLDILKITGVNTIPFRAIYALLSLFDIGTLCLHGRLSNIVPIKDIPVDTVNVRKLILGFDHVAPVAYQCAVLERVLSPVTLTEISITIRFLNERIERFCTFLGVVGQQLVKLDINISFVLEFDPAHIGHISDGSNEWTQQLPAAIAALPAIKLLYLRIDHPWTTDFDNLHGVIFSRLVSRTLERIVLELSSILAWQNVTTAKRLDRLELDGLSSCTRMPRLKTVVVLMGGMVRVDSGSWGELVAYAQGRFASLHAAGLLRIEHD